MYIPSVYVYLLISSICTFCVETTFSCFFIYTEIQCPSLSQPDNGTMQMTSNTVDGVASFYCLPTHDLEGSNRRVCGENGKWNGIQPECIGQ